MAVLRPHYAPQVAAPVLDQCVVPRSMTSDECPKAQVQSIFFPAAAATASDRPL